MADLYPDQASAQLTDRLGQRRAHFEHAAWYSLAALAYEENRLDEAYHALEASLVEDQFALIQVMTPGLLLQVRVLCERGENNTARTLLETLLARPQPSEVVREIHFCQAFLAFRRGDYGQVASWAAGRSTLGSLLSRARTVEEVLLLARLHIAQDQPEEATSLLAPLLAEVQAQGHGYAVLQTLVLQARACRAAGKGVQAKEVLLEAITRACPQGYVRLFLEEGEVMEQGLRELLPALHEPEQRAYVRTLLQASASARSPYDGSVREVSHQLVEPLTPQEQRALRLLARGASNQQIASALVIGVSAVKKHVSHLFAKLQVKNRTQAIVQARRWNLLEESERGFEERD